MTTIKTIDSAEQIAPVIAELEKAFFDIPFENSDFQNRAFLIAAQFTPARAYRSIGLQMFSKLRAVKDASFSIQLQEIDLEEMQSKIDNPKTDSFEKRRLIIRLQQAQDGQEWSRKLLNDALHELNVMYAEFKRFPSYTREEFEAEERLHFSIRLQQQMQLNGNGAAESMSNMTLNQAQLDRMLSEPEFLKGLQDDVITKLSHNKQS